MAFGVAPRDVNPHRDHTMVTQTDIDNYIASRATEGAYLDFKGGAALVRTDSAKSELVKDCSGFANADGGRIVYGIAEGGGDAAMTATSIDPVTEPSTTTEWITEVLRSNTSPPLQCFKVSEILQPNGGRVVVIDLEASGTAHQSLRDLKYYQRISTSTVPMVDFQIRDVMSRRRRAVAQVNLQFERLKQSDHLHRYRLGVALTNTGEIYMLVEGQRTLIKQGA